ncbi:uncharacterized protein LOC141853822 isoform X2 [Brevipalpus obovatus]|uniref:uncharacterized protein LOC141853822 isoform X2 n=1 Tax=Brevipalpus obovatus TaxID=246614 RepID=UPI003D9E7BAB
MEKQAVNQINSNTWNPRGSKHFHSVDSSSPKPPPPVKPPRKSLARGLSEQQSYTLTRNRKPAEITSQQDSSVLYPHYHTLSHTRKAPSFDHYLSDSGSVANDDILGRSTSNNIDVNDWTIFQTNRLSTFLGPERRKMTSFPTSSKQSNINNNYIISRSTTNVLDAVNRFESSSLHRSFDKDPNYCPDYSDHHHHHHHSSLSYSRDGEDVHILPKPLSKTGSNSSTMLTSHNNDTHISRDRQRSSYPTNDHHQHDSTSHVNHPQLNIHSRSKSEHHPRCPNRAVLHETIVQNDRAINDNSALEHFRRNSSDFKSIRDIDPPPPSQVALEEIKAVIEPLYQEYLAKKDRNCHDVETNTDDNFMAVEDDNGERVFVKLRRRKPRVTTEEKSVATDQSPTMTRLEINPFEGLFRGSKVLRKSEPIQDGRKSLRKSKQIGKSTLERRKKTRSLDLSRAKVLSVEAAKPIEPKPKLTEIKPIENKPSEPKAPKINPIELERSVLSRLSFDENKEWAEIAEIFASFGSGLSDKLSLFDKTSAPSSVSDWLKDISLEKYADLLTSNGFDDVEFMGSNVMEDSDLMEIGLIDQNEREKILQAAKTLPILAKTTYRRDNPVSLWLNSLRLGQYESNFSEKGYDTMEKVRKIWDVELDSALGVTKIGHKKRLLSSLGQPSNSKSDFGLNSLDFNKLDFSLDDLKLSGFNLHVMNHDQVEPSEGNSTKANVCESDQASISSDMRVDPLETSSLRSSFSSTTSFLSQWKHDPIKLYRQGCRFDSLYLGSTLVTQLQGVQSTRESIVKLKGSTKGIRKIPAVTLEISHTGVKFIDSQTNKLVCEHEIRNIHCACQDIDDFKYFAYITKEHETTNHFCHVFCAESVDLATEIILTLGQAFEIAYKITLGEDIQKLEEIYLSTRAKLASSSGQTDQTPSEQSSDSQCITKKELVMNSSPKSSRFTSNQQRDRERSASLSIGESSRPHNLHNGGDGIDLVEKRKIRPISAKSKEKPKVPTKPASLLRSFVASASLPRRKS